MAIVYVYPGTFGPPHRGHVNVAERMAQVVEKLAIICSINPEKDDRWFDPETCKKMWKTYDLAKNIEVMTFDEFMARHTDGERVVMVRGIRDEKDLAFEKKILEQNRRDYGIKDYHYIVADERFVKFSSTKARKFAKKGNLKKLARITNKQIAAIAIAKAKQIRKER